ncbi:MAG: acyltransferase, partial [Lachnospiraceae bacterium]|nr:acyltransferase [Lachnospiraceae bacterium]
MVWTKLFHARTFSGPLICLVSPHTEITMDRGAELRIGSGFKMRDGAKIRVRKGASCKMGRNVSINSNNMIACHESIEIGNDVQFSPNVQIYDHDHDYRVDGGIKAGKFRTSPVKIGSNVWIGANTVILRGTEIGDNCIIGAGC